MAQVTYRGVSYDTVSRPNQNFKPSPHVEIYRGIMFYVDEHGNKMNHSDENIRMVCAFMNMGRNDINRIEDFIDIFNNKFPNRIKDIKVIYPEDYEYILKYGCFVNKKYAETNLWQGGEMAKYQLLVTELS